MKLNKIRVIPKGFTQVNDDVLRKEIVIMAQDHSVGDFFLGLYMRFGNPLDGGIYTYMIRSGNVVLRIEATESNVIRFGVYVSPELILDAKRKKTKAVNVIARRLNNAGVVFVPDKELSESLYFAVKKKNSELMEKQSLSHDKMTEQMNNAMTKGEKQVLHGGISQFIPEVEGTVREMINTICA